MLAYEYKAGSARLDDLPEVPISPHLYILCNRCAESLRPPRGWVLDDRRTKEAPVVDIAAVETAHVPPPSPAPAPETDELDRREGNRQLAFGYSS